METRATTSPMVIDAERHTLLLPPRLGYAALRALSTRGVTPAGSGTARFPVPVGLYSTRRYRMSAKIFGLLLAEVVVQMARQVDVEVITGLHRFDPRRPLKH